MGANLRIFQLSYTTLSQIALKANMHCLAKVHSLQSSSHSSIVAHIFILFAIITENA